MIDILVLGLIITGAVSIISVGCYNLRRSRCVKCKGCGMELERELMTEEMLKDDKLVIPTTL